MLADCRLFVIIISCLLNLGFAEPTQTGRVWLGDDLSFSTDPENIGEKENWYSIDLDDSRWDKINTLASYQKQGYSGYKGFSWYRKEFIVPNDWQGKTINLEVTIVKEPSKLYINGKLVGVIYGWLQSFDVSSFLEIGKKNLIAIKMYGNSNEDGLYRRTLQLLLMDPVVNIGISSAIPVVGQEVWVSVYMPQAAGKKIEITAPNGNKESLTLDDNSKAFWKPLRYGKYIISYENQSKLIWVTVEKLFFHYWDESSLPIYATDVLSFDTNEPARAKYWRKSGVNYSSYGYGLELEGKDARQINEKWAESYDNDIHNGITVDEHFCSTNYQQMAMTEALVLARKLKGEDFEITPYLASASTDAVKCFWDLRKANAKIMWENYEGDYWTFQKRWLDVKYWRMDEQGGVLAQAPGLSFGQEVRGATTVEAFEEEIRRIRAIAPEMRGFANFNGYLTDELDIASGLVIENYFFQPLIHIHPKDGKLAFQNIGNEDTPDDIIAVFYSNSTELTSELLPTLKPQEMAFVAAPNGATAVKLHISDEMKNLYPDGYEIPGVLDPLQVVSTSVKNLEKIILRNDEPLTLKFIFNKEIGSFSTEDISLYDTNLVSYSPDKAVFDNPTKTLQLTYNKLPQNDYSLALKSSNSQFRDLDNNRLDGSGDGLLATSKEGVSYTQIDDYTLYFTIETVKSVTANCNINQTGGVYLGKEISFNIDPDDKGEKEKWYLSDYDSSKWAKINCGKCYEKQGFDGYDGVAWYKKSFLVPNDWKNKQVYLEITVLNAAADCYINGTNVGKLQGWHIKQDVSNCLKVGQINTVAIRTTDKDKEGGLFRECFQLVLMNPVVAIGLSNRIPVVGESIEITIFDVAGKNKIEITAPGGSKDKLKLNPEVKALWKPQRYGRYNIAYNGINKAVWVTAKPLMFHYWDDTMLPKYATHVIGFDDKEQEREQYWHKNGVKYISYSSGYGHEDKSPKEINDSWAKNYQNPIFDGMSIDEICPDLRPMQIAMTDAIVLAREKMGDDFVIAPYIAGLAYENFKGFWNFKKADAKLLWENYWGEPWLYQQRWLDIKYTGLDKNGALLCIAPGFTGENIHGSLTVEQLKEEFAIIRRIAPEMQGLAFFNAYFARELDEACDAFIEDFFLKPIIHIHPKNGKLVFQNIGNEDLPKNIKAAFHGGNTSEISLPRLKPYQSYEADVPQDAVKVKLKIADFMMNLYPDGYEIPKVLNPLQVVRTSIDNLESVKLEKGKDFEIAITFNNKLNSFTVNDISLFDYNSKQYYADDLEFDAAANELTLIYRKLSTNDYTLILKDSIKDSSGNPLDGSGDGMFKDRSSQMDCYTKYFTISE